MHPIYLSLLLAGLGDAKYGICSRAGTKQSLSSSQVNQIARQLGVESSTAPSSPAKQGLTSKTTASKPVKRALPGPSKSDDSGSKGASIPLQQYAASSGSGAKAAAGKQPPKASSAGSDEPAAGRGPASASAPASASKSKKGSPVSRPSAPDTGKAGPSGNKGEAPESPPAPAAAGNQVSTARPSSGACRLDDSQPAQTSCYPEQSAERTNDQRSNLDLESGRVTRLTIRDASGVEHTLNVDTGPERSAARRFAESPLLANILTSKLVLIGLVTMTFGVANFARTVVNYEAAARIMQRQVGQSTRQPQESHGRLPPGIKQDDERTHNLEVSIERPSRNQQPPIPGRGDVAGRLGSPSPRLLKSRSIFTRSGCSVWEDPKVSALVMGAVFDMVEGGYQSMTMALQGDMIVLKIKKTA
ncbi:hypothetical protein CAC42_2810 [Sphaceloma murrayae]|uniref:Uncharacterized protein n=1 Tax=Sphaceloma murrayae TaxID=2082308 RepID=A0A2K1R0P5_9PEZI|nr:hypothetical protein CAC42_2810 [Sphaceloma murrayae]